MDVLTRSLKVALAALLAMLLVAIGLSVILLAVLKLTDWSEHKGMLSAAVERVTDWEVEQLGDIEIELFFPTVIIIDDIELSRASPQSALSSVAAEHFRISFDPLSPFLDERLVIHDIQSSGARISARPPTEEAPEQEGLPSIPYVKSVRIRDSRIRYEAGPDQEGFRASIARLDMVSSGRGKGTLIAGRGKIQGMDFSIDGNLGSHTALLHEKGPLPIDLEIFLAGDAFTVEGEVDMQDQGLSFVVEGAAKGDNLSQIGGIIGVHLEDVRPYGVRFSASGSADQVNLETMQLTLGESHLSGQASLQLDRARPYLRADLKASPLRRQDLTSLVPQAQTQSGEPMSFSFLEVLDADVRLSVAEYREKALGLIISGAMLEASLEDGRLTAATQLKAQGMRIDLDGVLGPPPDSAAESEGLPFELEATAPGNRFLLEGRLISGGQGLVVDAEVAAKGDNLGRVAQAFGVPLHDVPDYEARFLAEASVKEVAIEGLQLTLGQSSLNGNAQLRLDQATAYLHADLDAPLLRRKDLVSLMPQIQEGSGDQSQTQSAFNGSAALGFLNAFNAGVDLSVAEYEGDTLGNSVAGADLEVSLDDGLLEVVGQVNAHTVQLTVAGALGPPPEPTAQPQALPFTLEAGAAGDTLTVEGQLMPSQQPILVADLAIRGNNLGRIAELAGIPLGNVPPYKGAVSVRVSEKKISMEDIQFTLGHSYLYGMASLDHGAGRPQLRADLGVSLLRREDIERVILQGEATRKAPDDPLNLDFLQALDAEVDLAIAEYQGETLGDIIGGAKLDISLAGGQLGVSGRLTANETDLTLVASLGLAGQQEPGTLPFEIEVGTAGDTLALEGQIITGARGRFFEMDGSFEGGSLGQITRMLGVRLDDAPPYRGSFSATASPEQVSLHSVELTLGNSHGYGEATLQLGGERPYLEGDFVMPLVRQDDLWSLIGKDEEPRQQGEGGEQDAEKTLVFSRQPVPVDWLRQADADIRLRVDNLEGERLGRLAGGLVLEASLEDGRLSVDPFEFALTDGILEGNLLLSARSAPAELRADLKATGVDLENLFAAIIGRKDEKRRARGELRGYLQLRSAGRTPHQWASRLNGELGVAIFDGALPAIFVEAIGLDLAETLASGIGQDALTDINCGVGSFEIRDGVVQTEALILSTDDANIVGKGQVDLGEERVDLHLEAFAKDFSVFASASPIRITGPLNNAQASLLTGELAATVVAAAALALVNPFLAAIPFVELGLAEEGRCRELEGELRQIQAENGEQ